VSRHLIAALALLPLIGVTLSVVSPNEATSNTVTVSTTGLGIDNSAWSQEVDGIVTGAEVADLNVDASPEIYVYVRSGGASRSTMSRARRPTGSVSCNTCRMPEWQAGS
jgi:hypothetical protein